MTIDISKRSSGAEGIGVAECIDRHMGTWRVRTDFQPTYDEQHEQTGVSFIETQFPYKPTLAEVKDFVNAVINAQTEEKILKGFQWTQSGEEEAVNVWLSEENQRNFSEAQRMAEKYGSAVLPLTFKLGEQEDATPVYHTFETFEELNQFYLAAFAWVNRCLQEGWNEKDSFDFTPYEEALN